MLYEIHVPTLLEVHLPKKHYTEIVVSLTSGGSIHSKPLSSNKCPENIENKETCFLL